MRRCRCGFSLIELMAALAIVAVLAAVAVPAYGRYTYRARRVDGKELLWRIAHAQERYYATYNRYGELPDLGFAEPVLSDKGFYKLTLRLAGLQSFMATASPLAMQLADACGALALDDTGKQTPGTDDVVANSNGGCW